MTEARSWPEQVRRAATPEPPQLALPPGQRQPAAGERAAAEAFSGTASVVIPIPLPAARGAPELSLAYSQSLQNGPFGLGFGLDLPVIGRATALRVPRYEDSDVFTGPGGEQLTPGLREEAGEWVAYRWVAQEDGAPYDVRVYRARRDGDGQRLERWTAADGDCFWKRRDDSGGVEVYGRSAGARIADPRAPARVARWLLEERVDALGNRVRYTYRPEDGAGWSGWTAGGFAQRYPAAIEFANYEGPGGAAAFAFEVRFDYGELEPLSSLEPVRPWPLRADPLIECRAGFPLQTLRLCRNVLVVNRVAEPGTPHVTSVLELGYEEDPVHTRLTSARLVGLRGDDEEAETASLPAVELSYAEFPPGDAEWRPITLAGGASPPPPLGAEGGSDLILADLHGEGLPGLLAGGPDGPLYFPPLGDGVVGAGQPLDRFPDLGGNGGGIQLSWEDVEGNGHLSPVLLTDSMRGFFYNAEDGWRPYRPFGALPEEALSTAARWADVDGDGRADLLIQAPGALRCYLDRGASGFGPPLTTPVAGGFPLLDAEDERAVVLFADVLGDGLAHCVRVEDGVVQVWPNLGYGRFAEPYAMEGAPALRPELLPNRILLADLTGSGRDDLVLLYPDRAEIHENRSGRGFGPALRVPIPGGLDPLDEVSLSDVEGRGLASLVIAKAGPGGGTAYLRFDAEDPAFLLTGCGNGIGATTSFGYRSSTDFYLADRAAGRPWATRLATPVTVVDRVEHHDAVAAVTTVETRRYRDGWYDPVERVFRGFGSVQTEDVTGLDPGLRRREDGAAAGASLVREWFEVGAAVDGERLRQRFRAEQFDPGPGGIELGPTALLAPIADGGGRLLREAATAAVGRALHTETYAVEDGQPAAVPFVVEDHAYAVEMVQPGDDGECGAFRVLGRESVSSDYEEVAGDPRVEYDALLAWDMHGIPTAWATVFYPRRAPALPAQEELRATLHEQRHIAIDDPATFLTGLTWDDRQSQLGGLRQPPAGTFTYAGLAAEVATARAPQNRVPYGTGFSGGAPQARAFLISQTVFWDAAGAGPAPLGSAGPRALLHHQRDAVFPSGFPERAYGGRVDAAMLEAEAGLHLEDGLWWQDGLVVSYLGAAGFFRPRSFRTPFQTDATATVAAYDAYSLFAVSVTDGYGFEATAAPDYEAMEPGSVTDVNGVVTQGIYDPLARLVAIAQHAETDAGYLGDMDLASYDRRPAPTVEQLVADPGHYLQGARMYFLHALAGADPGRVPAAMASVQATAYAGSAGATRPAATPLLTVTHLDGFGRTLEALERVEGAAASSPGEWAWASTSRVDYDERGSVLRSYLPAFLPSWRFAGPGARPFASFSYDALGRQVREDDAKGFLTRTTYDDAWTERHYDADDTVTESRYYREHIDDPALPPAERRALELAAGFAGTPLIAKRDPQGFVVEEDATELSGETLLAYPARSEVDVRGLVTALADPRLGLQHPNVRTELDMLGRALRVRRADAGQNFLLHDAMDQPVRRWSARGAVVATTYDTVIRRPLRESVELAGATAVTRTFAYGDDRGTLSVNRLVRAEDQAGRHEIASYDLLGEAAEASWRFARQFEGMIDWSDPGSVELLAETWACRWQRDPAGRPLAERCADGSVLRYARYANGWLRGAGVDGAAPAAVDGGAYLAGGQPIAAAYANGVQLRWDHDPLTLELVRARAEGPSRLQDLTYTLDPVGNVCTIEDTAAAKILGGERQTLVKEFDYDARYRLGHGSGWESTPSTPPWRPYEESYRYDDGGNLLAIDHSVEGAGETREFKVAEESNRSVLATMVDPTHPLDGFFDAAGNLLADETGTRFAYDYDEQLAGVAATAPGGAAAWYRYDGDGIRRRRRVTVAGTATDCLRVGSTYIVAGPTETSFAVLCRGYADDLFLAERDDAKQEPVLRYLVPDRLGSVTVEAGGDGGLLRYEDFLPYGAPSVRAGPGAEPPLSFGFSGKERDAETGLDYFGARFYKATWGRWLTPDPLGEEGGLNLYSYVEANPVSAHDAHGYKKFLPLNRRAYGQAGKSFLQAGSGGDIISGRIGKKNLTVYRWKARSTNTGAGISRKYPMTSKAYRVLIKDVTFNRRVTRSMFKAGQKVAAGLLRGHGIPHADTMVNTPASGGLLSTLDPENYSPELEGWGEQQRKRREEKARRRETPVVQVNEYAASPKRTGNGTPVPERLWFVELTALATDQTYAGSKSYSAKGYMIDYKTFNYDAMAAVSPGSDRRRLKTLRVKSVPQFVLDAAQYQAKIPSWFKFKF